MTYLKQQFDQYSSEYLLEQRARGDELSDEAHAAIEAVFRERGELLPPRPAQPIHVESPQTAWDSAWLKVAGGLLLLFAAAVAARVILDSWIAFPLAFVLGGYYIVKMARRARLAPAQRAQEDFATITQARGMTELMLCAATCDVARARDLLNFQPQVDERDASGATALMYAARNGCTELTRLLLAAGADRSLRTPQGSIARDIALRYGHTEIVTLLEDQ